MNRPNFDPIKNLLPKGTRNLFIGPWVGEFGIEIIHWQGLARAIASAADWKCVVASSYPDREFLYSDFTNLFKPITPPSHHTVGPKCLGFDVDFDRAFETFDFSPEDGDLWLSPIGSIGQFRRFSAAAAAFSEFRNFSDHLPVAETEIDLIIHARATEKSGQGKKNWSVQNWEALLEGLPSNLRIASVGSRHGAHKIRGTSDHRGIELRRLAQLCGAAKMIIGPSSGAIHFALHCGTSALTWMGEHRHHYYPQWNPFQKLLICLNSWQPTPEMVLQRFKDLWYLSASQEKPIRDLVIATKRSGHHAFVDWLISIQPGIELTYWNDCFSKHLRTRPFFESTIPTEALLPKQIHQLMPRDMVIHRRGDPEVHQRIISLESPSLRELAQLPEAHQAKRLIFVLRDSMNLISSLFKTFRKQYQKNGLLNSELQESIHIYREYLFEAVGKTNILGPLREKALFISYNRWHLDTDYRYTIFNQLRSADMEIEPPRGHVAQFGPRSRFQDSTTPAEKLLTCERWWEFVEKLGFATAAISGEIASAESQFHRSYAPASQVLNSILTDRFQVPDIAACQSD